MNRNTLLKNVLLAVSVLCMGLILCPNDTVAFSIKSADIDHIKNSETNYKINTLFMEIHPKKGYVIAGEIMIYLMDFKTGGEHYRTVFVNEQGDSSYAGSVKASHWVGKRVVVKGYKLDSGEIVAESIEKVAARNKKKGK